ncbi:metal-dependent transcriptional regulator [Arthrobacter sp. H41]|uniref:metal-dependent transcriptional regulator n=1 Tax=Arthrobacter sp. H41 TaxID=1312978 RepID=UPI0006765B2A|nr:metal-dependent transcriptional regulator [Arthrobacter sp. H41]
MVIEKQLESTLPCCVIEHSETVENYLKAVFHMSSVGEPAATTTLIAERLGVAPPSVSAMVKRLEENDLVSHAGRGRVVLTDHGREHALAVVRRHRLLETFLHRFLKMGWDEVHVEAERLEHALSPRLEDRIDEALGFPTRDPHGDPIPPKHGPHDEAWGMPLDRTAPGCLFLVERISDRDSAALRYLAELGILPGVELTVQERAPFDGPLWVELGGQRYALGSTLTRLIHGTVLPATGQATTVSTDLTSGA